MKNLIAFVLLLSTSAWGKALIDPSLKNFAQGRSLEATTRVLLLVATPQAVLQSLPKPQRYQRSGVVQYYQEVTRRATMPLLQSIQQKTLVGVRVLKVFWVNGSVLAEVTPQGLMNLAQLESVRKIYRNGKTLSIPAVARMRGNFQIALEAQKQDYNMTTLGIDKLFSEQPKIQGAGVVMGEIDTGVDANHPILKGKVVAFYNGREHKNTEPVDLDQHGTHVAGLIAGGTREGTWIGIAPQAKLAVAGVITEGYDEMLEGMQWMIDRSKNPTAAQIRAVSCSWHAPDAPDMELFYRAISSWEAAGVLPVFAAGNFGKDDSRADDQIGHPQEHPATLTVAAYDSALHIADFSSRGPGHHNGKDTLKPEISAPGVKVNSSIPGNGFAKWDGTSMATPHVSGTIALLLQINPNLNPVQIRDLLIRSALNPEGTVRGQWDKAWGYGRLSAYQAVKVAQNLMHQMGNFSLTSETFGGSSSQLFGDLVNSVPEEIDVNSFNQETLGEVGSRVDQWEGTDEMAWLQVSDI